MARVIEKDYYYAAKMNGTGNGDLIVGCVENVRTKREEDGTEYQMISLNNLLSKSEKPSDKRLKVLQSRNKRIRKAEALGIVEVFDKVMHETGNRSAALAAAREFAVSIPPGWDKEGNRVRSGPSILPPHRQPKRKRKTKVETTKEKPEKEQPSTLPSMVDGLKDRWKEEHALPTLMEEIPQPTKRLIELLWEQAANTYAKAGLSDLTHDGGAENQFQTLCVFIYGWTHTTPPKWVDLEREADPEWKTYQRLRQKFE